MELIVYKTIVLLLWSNSNVTVTLCNSKADSSLFIKTKKEVTIYILIYVDDLNNKHHLIKIIQLIRSTNSSIFYVKDFI